MPERKHDFLHLPAFELCQKISLIFHRIGSGAEPNRMGGEVDGFVADGVAKHLIVADAACIMTGTDAVVGMTHLLLKRTKLDEAVAHHVGVGSKSLLHMPHRIAHHALPILLLKVNGLERQPVASGDGLAEFEVFFGSAREFVIVVHTDFDVEEVGAQSALHQQVGGHGAVYAAGEKEGNVHRFLLSRKGCRGKLCSDSPSFLQSYYFSMI